LIGRPEEFTSAQVIALGYLIEMPHAAEDLIPGREVARRFPLRAQGFGLQHLGFDRADDAVNDLILHGE
jgi:hypothetical protein